MNPGKRKLYLNIISGLIFLMVVWMFFRIAYPKLEEPLKDKVSLCNKNNLLSWETISGRPFYIDREIKLLDSGEVEIKINNQGSVASFKCNNQIPASILYRASKLIAILHLNQRVPMSIGLLNKAGRGGNWNNEDFTIEKLSDKSKMSAPLDRAPIKAKFNLLNGDIESSVFSFSGLNSKDDLIIKIDDIYLE